MIQWVYESTLKYQAIDETIIATDDHRISQMADSYGGKVIMTDWATSPDRN